MSDLLIQIGEENVTSIGEELGFELCRMDSVDALIIGSFAKLGDMFATDAKVLDAKTKELLKPVSSRGKGEDSILDQIDELSDEISRGVGLSESAMQADQRSIAEVTTNSTEAYQSYIKGITELGKSNFEDARIFFENAVQHDSTFAMAHLYLAIAWSQYILPNVNAIKQAYERANALSFKAPEKERLYIEAGYARIIERNTDKARQIYQQMVKLYPKEKFAHLFLSQIYSLPKYEMHSDAINELDIALELDPLFGLAYQHVVVACVAMNDYDRAINYAKKYKSVSPVNAQQFDILGDLYFQKGDLNKAIENYEKALKLQADFSANWKIAFIYALREDYAETMKWIDRHINMARSPGTTAEGLVWRAFYHLWLGRANLAYGELVTLENMTKTMGNEEGTADLNLWIGWTCYVKRNYEDFHKHFSYFANFFNNRYPSSFPFTKQANFLPGLYELKLGRIKNVRSKLTQWKSYLRDSDELRFYYNLLYGEILLAQDSLTKAISIAENIKPYKILPNIRSLANASEPFCKDVLARAYHKNGELDKAVKEYERHIKFDPNSPERFIPHPQYHYRLAKLYQEKGATQKAIKEYEKFLDIWKDADEDLPELIDARARYAKLFGEK